MTRMNQRLNAESYADVSTAQPLVTAREDVHDSALMELALRGDAGAFADLVRRYWSPLAAYARRLLDGSREAGEDLAQEAFLRIWNGRLQWRPTGSVRAFLYGLVRNLALNERRSARVRLRAAGRIRAMLRDWYRRPSPLDLVEQAEERAAIERAIARLPPRRREIFILVRVHGMSYGEVAQILDISPQTVANQMSAAFTTLRRLL
ncbi:MAG TPA: sigma-70 family RNA polymerase sigma factor [Longimicrobiales bacterium]